MTRVQLVTGFSGFVGRNLFTKLRTVFPDTEGLGDEYLIDKDWKNTLREILDRIYPSTIYHVGACSNTLEDNVQNMMVRNYESTKVICDWGLLHDCKIIFSSSAANYGENGSYPSNLYGWSKYVAEDYVLKTGGVSLRYFNVYGPGEEQKGEMASFIYQAYLRDKNRTKIFLFPGKPQRDFVYISDVILANMHASKIYHKLRGGYFEVSTGIASSYEKVMEIMDLPYEYYKAELIPRGYQFYTCGDSSKWMSGWEPEYSLNQGIAEYKFYLKGMDKH
jgi:ADP-L-glycero-D-manno-heptose 6-epimerase